MIDDVEGDDHERYMLCFGNELPEGDGDSESCDVSRCFWSDAADSDRVSSKVPCSLFMGTMSRNHSSSSWEGVFMMTGFRRKTLYGDKRCGEFVRVGGTGVGSHRFGR